MQIKTQGEFIDLYSEVSGFNKKSVKDIIDSIGNFIEYCIENNISFRVPKLFELKYFKMKSRRTVRIDRNGSSEMVDLPVTIKPKLILSSKLRRKQSEQSKVMRPILEDIMEKEEEDFDDV